MKLFIVAVLFLSGYLFNFSVFNFSGRGLAFFWVVTFVILLCDVKILFNIRRDLKYILLLASVFIIIFLIHSLFFSDRFFSSFFQLVSRLMLLLYGYVICFYALSMSVNDSNKIILFVKILIYVTLISGCWEYYALKNNINIFHYIFANNPSFSQTVEGVKIGWNESYRVRGFWGEASYSAMFFIIAGSLLMFYRLNGQNSRYFLLLSLMTLYGYFTSSRIVWALLIVIYLITFFEKLFCRFCKTNSLLKVLSIAALIVITNFWVLIVDLLFQDVSALGRSGSVVVGLRVRLQNILIGTGFNSFLDYSYIYSDSKFGALDEPVVHNLLVSYLQQIGLFTFPLFIYYFSLLKRLSLDVYFYYFTISVLLVGSLLGDVFYFSIIWCFYALSISYSKLKL